MTVDWGKGSRAFQQGEREVKLQVQEEVAEIRMYQGEIHLEKEKKKGNEGVASTYIQL